MELKSILLNFIILESFIRSLETLELSIMIPETLKLVTRILKLCNIDEI